MQFFDEILEKAKNVLICGAGGGYDITGGVPLLTYLVGKGKCVTIGSLSFTNVEKLPNYQDFSEIEGLDYINSTNKTEKLYCPEAWICDWLEKTKQIETGIWIFDKLGAKQVSRAYEYIVKRYNIDTIILVDGGVDAVLKGNETSIGTPAEDLVSLAAAYVQNVPEKLVCCVGFGSEIRDGVLLGQALARVAELTKENGFYGVAAIESLSEFGKDYMNVVSYLFENQKGLKTSHIHGIVLDAIAGGFGRKGKHVYLTPLLNMIWFFNLNTVFETHCFAKHILETENMFQSAAIAEGFRKDLEIQDKYYVDF